MFLSPSLQSLPFVYSTTFSEHPRGKAPLTTMARGISGQPESKAREAGVGWLPGDQPPAARSLHTGCVFWLELACSPHTFPAENLRLL